MPKVTLAKHAYKYKVHKLQQRYILSPWTHFGIFSPSLTWRDIQHVVVQGTRIPSADSSWTINGGGHHVSHKFGFGLMDCGKMVQVAQQWKNVPEQHVCQFDRNDPQ